jgi:lipopolysaccharide export system protein LptC
MVRSRTKTREARAATEDWQARATASLDRAERYSKFVRAMRIALPFAAAVLIGVIVLYSIINKPAAQIALSYETMEETAGLVAMTAPRFNGIDRDGRFYIVTADEAKRPAGKFDKIELQMVHAEIKEGSEARLVMNASKGTIDADANHLVFGPQVWVDLQDGFTFNTDHAFADLTTGTIVGKTPVRGDSPFGTFSADRFELIRSQQIVRLSGNVTFTINPESLKDAPESLKDLNDRRASEKNKLEGAP